MFVVDAVTTVSSVRAPACAVKLYAWQFQLVVADAKATTPELAAVPVPTLTRKLACPLLDTIDGAVPKKPEEIVGAAAVINLLALS